MADYPILFRTTKILRCDDFSVLVVAEGRVRMTHEEGEWWCHGVEPGGLTENGVGPFNAFERFRESFWQSLEDLMDQSHDCAKFEAEAQAFFATHESEARSWEVALEAFRNGQPVDEVFRNMPRIPPRESSLKIAVLDDFATAPMEAANEVAALPKAA